MDWLSSYITSFAQQQQGDDHEPSQADEGPTTQPSSRHNDDDKASTSTTSGSGSAPPCSSTVCHAGCNGGGDTDDDSSSHALDEIDCEVPTTTTTTASSSSSPDPGDALTSRPRQVKGEDVRFGMEDFGDGDDDAIQCCLHFGMAAILLTGFLAYMAVHMGSLATSSQGRDLPAILGTVIVLAVALCLLGCLLVAAMASCSDSTALKQLRCNRQLLRRAMDPSKVQSSDENEGMDSASTIDTGSVTSSSSSSSDSNTSTTLSSEAESKAESVVQV